MSALPGPHVVSTDDRGAGAEVSRAAVGACWSASMLLLATPLLGSWDYLGIAVGSAVAVVALGVVAWSARRPSRERSAVHAAADARRPEPAGEAAGRVDGAGAGETGGAAGITRRVVVERGVIGVSVAALAGVVTASVAYVVGALDASGGRRFTLGSAEDIRSRMRTTGRPFYDPVGGFYVVPYPPGDLAEARSHYAGAVLDGMEDGFVALDQTCTHLGCRVPWCPSSHWFECPCHGSRYNAVGEPRRGPAPRGLDRYRVTVVDGQVIVDTAAKYLGPPPGTDTTGQPPAGPHCFEGPRFVEGPATGPVRSRRPVLGTILEYARRWCPPPSA